MQVEEGFTRIKAGVENLLADAGVDASGGRWEEAGKNLRAAVGELAILIEMAAELHALYLFEED